jgi:hypothetical protein
MCVRVCSNNALCANLMKKVTNSAVYVYNGTTLQFQRIYSSSKYTFIKSTYEKGTARLTEPFLLLKIYANKF